MSPTPVCIPPWKSPVRLEPPVNPDPPVRPPEPVNGGVTPVPDAIVDPVGLLLAEVGIVDAGLARDEKNRFIYAANRPLIVM